MSAVISNDVQMKEILKATGYDCPAELEGKTFSEATAGGGSGGSGIELIELSATKNDIYVPGENRAYSRVTVSVRQKTTKLYAYVSSNVDVPYPIYLYKSTVPSSDFTGQTTCFKVDKTKLNLEKTNFYGLQGDNPTRIDDNSFSITGSTFTRNEHYDIEFTT